MIPVLNTILDSVVDIVRYIIFNKYINLRIMNIF